MEEPGVQGEKGVSRLPGPGTHPICSLIFVAAAGGTPQHSVSSTAVSQPGGLSHQPDPAPWAPALLPHLCP